MSSDNFLNVPLNLQTVLKSSYLTKEQASSLLSKNGYSFDEISNNNTRVFYNPDENKTLLTIRGTKNLINDIPTDFSVFLGTDDLQKTKRYKETEAIYKKAKGKYNNLTIFGHSLGGSLANALPTDEKDRVFTYNKGVGLINHNTKANEMALRTQSDIISFLSKNDKHTTNFGGVNLNLLETHNLDQLSKIKPIRI
jgi:hypothetical protein